MSLPIPQKHKHFTDSQKAELLEYIIFGSGDKDFCADIESNHPKVYKNDFKLHGVGFCVDEARVYIDDLDVCSWVFDEMEKQDRRVIGHNFKFDQQALRKGGVRKDFYYNYVDTLIILNMIDENMYENMTGLKINIKKEYGYAMGSWEEESQFNKKTGWMDLNTPRFHFYGCDDVYWNLKWWKETLEPQFIEISDSGHSFESLWNDVTRMGTIYATEMEENGMFINLEEVRFRLLKWAEIRSEVEKEIRAMVGKKLNIASGAQLKKLFFGDWGWPTGGLKLTKKGKELRKAKQDYSDYNYVSLDEEGMEILFQKYGRKYPALNKVARWRSCNKAIGTYLLPVALNSLENGDGKVYPSYYLTSATGRKRCRNPNLQNQKNEHEDIVINDITWKKEDIGVRRIYEAQEGRVHIVSDLSQAELRLCAHISQDKAMMSAYLEWSCGCGAKGSSKVLKTKCPKCGELANEDYLKGKTRHGFWHGKDIHQMTADATGIPRADSKSVNFAAIYGASAWTMESQFGVYTQDKWQEILNAFFRLYYGVRQWHRWSQHEMETEECIHDLFGRRRIVTARMQRQLGKRALNMFVNMPVQGSGAHYLMIAENKIRTDFIKKGWWFKKIWPVLEVHDEIVFECDEDIAEEASLIIHYWMRYAVQLDVPMDASIMITKSWGLAK